MYELDEIKRLTEENERLRAALETANNDAREMTARFDLLNNVACDVVDWYFNAKDATQGNPYALMSDLRDATIDDGRAPHSATPAPTAQPASVEAETRSKRAYTLPQKIGHIDGNLKNWENVSRTAVGRNVKDNYLSYILNDINDALQMIADHLKPDGDK